MTSYGAFIYVVSAFRRTSHGPAEAGHYVPGKIALRYLQALQSLPCLADLNV